MNVFPLKKLEKISGDKISCWNSTKDKKNIRYIDASVRDLEDKNGFNKNTPWGNYEMSFVIAVD